MPCESGQGQWSPGYDDDPETRRRSIEAVRLAQELKAEADHVTRILCRLCRSLVKQGVLIDILRQDDSAELLAWWSRHQVEDAARGEP